MDFVDFTYCGPNNGQQIKKAEENNTIFNCLNRHDELPFGKKNQTTSTKGAEWLTKVNEPCPDAYGLKGKEYRRCLGHNPDQCVRVDCKCILYYHWKAGVIIFFK